MEENVDKVIEILLFLQQLLVICQIFTIKIFTLTSKYLYARMKIFLTAICDNFPLSKFCAVW